MVHSEALNKTTNKKMIHPRKVKIEAISDEIKSQISNLHEFPLKLINRNYESIYLETTII
jgi:hypothetical protein